MTIANTPLIDRVHSIYNTLASASSLKPAPHINEAFTELVQLTVQASASEAAAVLTDGEIVKIIPHLRAMCFEGECHLELHWAEKIAHNAHSATALQAFPYYDNYLKLTQLEHHSLSLVGSHSIMRVLFVGSGPLPLSAILLAQQYGLTVDCIDSDTQAVEVSKQLVSRLGLTDTVHIAQADAATFAQYGKYDAVFLAAMVGLEATTKQSIIAAIGQQMKQGGLLVVRTAHGLRTLLYPPVDIDLIEGFDAQVVVQPLNEVVNSVIVLEQARTIHFDKKELR